MPTMASAKPPRKLPVKRSRKNSQPANATQIGAALPSSVAFDTELRWMAQFHTTRSRPRNSPPRAIRRNVPASRGPTGCRCPRAIHSHRNGRAKRNR